MTKIILNQVVYGAFYAITFIVVYIMSNNTETATQFATLALGAAVIIAMIAFAVNADLDANLCVKKAQTGFASVMMAIATIGSMAFMVAVTHAAIAAIVFTGIISLGAIVAATAFVVSSKEEKPSFYKVFVMLVLNAVFVAVMMLSFVYESSSVGGVLSMIALVSMLLLDIAVLLLEHLRKESHSPSLFAKLVLPQDCPQGILQV